MTIPLITGLVIIKTVQATPATAQAIIDAAADGTDVRLGAGTYGRLNVRSKRIRLTLLPGCTIAGSGIGIWFNQPRTCELIGDPAAIVSVPGGDGIQQDGGTLIVSRVRIGDCLGQGVLIKSAGGAVTQVDRCELWANGKQHVWWTGDATYWKYGSHSCYAGADSSGSPTKLIFIDNYVHDQHTGYGVQLGGQARDCIVAWNRFERIDAAADPSQAGDRDGNAVQLFSSYLGSRGNLIANNLARDVAGYIVGSDASSVSQGVARNNVGWRVGGSLKGGLTPGLIAHVAGVTDGGANVLRDIATLEDALALGLFDSAYVPQWVAAQPRPLTVDDYLDLAWATIQKTGLFQQWAAASPGEWSAISSYRSSGGAVPKIASYFGQALLAQAQAWRL